MARMINHLFHNTDALLVDFNGGTKDNAIPRETSATLFYSDEVAAKMRKIWLWHSLLTFHPRSVRMSRHFSSL